MTEPAATNGKRWKQILNNIYTSGFDKNTDLETLRKVVLLNILFSTGLMMLIPFGIMAHLRGQPLTGIADHLAALVVIFLFFHMRRTHTYALATYACTFVFMLLFMMLFIQGGIDYSGPLWSLTLPVFTLFAFGLKAGAAASLAYLAILGLWTVLSPTIPAPIPYSPSFLLRYFGVYLTIFAISFFFEAARARTRSAFVEKEAVLKRTIEDLGRTEQTLQYSEHRLRTVVGNIPLVLFAVDSEGIFILSEGKGLEELGLKPGEVVGKSCFEFYKHVPQIAKNINKSLSGRIIHDSVLVSNMVFETWFHPIRSEDDTITGVIGVSINVTQRKRAEEALQESERKYREMADLLPQPIFETNLRGKVTFLSHSGYYLSGYTKEDLKKRLSAQDIFIPEDRKRLRENNERVLGGERIGGIEYTVRRKDGSTFPVILHSTPILKNDRAVGTRGVIIDISQTKEAAEEKQELEKKLARAEKMEAIGRLAGSVAHDLNNILGAIVGYPDLILLNLPKNSNLAKPVQAMKESGQKAAAIVQDLLTLARRGVTSDEILDLNAIVYDYMRSPEFEKMLNIHPGVKVETDMDRKLLKIKGSALQLSKSLMNMVSNAAEAMPDGGLIIIGTRNQNLESPEQGYDSLILPGDYTVLTIKDEGVGIPDNILKNIFEPFFTKKTMGRSGTGLGMSVVWGSVADHNGKIAVTSTPGEGTTFDLYFPITRKDIPPEKVKKQFGEYLGRGERILVVDDIEEQQNIADSLLTKLGYRVDTVSSGEAAIKYISHRSPDLVILDMIMPQGIDGLNTYQEIHKIKPETRVIITSGFSETERVKAAQDLGAGPYLRKPYTLEAIGAVVHQELEKNKKS